MQRDEPAGLGQFGARHMSVGGQAIDATVAAAFLAALDACLQAARQLEDGRGMLAGTTPDGWVPLGYATQALGVSRQTLLQKVKRGELRAVLTRNGRRKGLRIEIPAPQEGLF